MTLSEYLQLHGLSPAAFGRKIKVTKMAVYRYLDGSRVPKRDVMARIKRVTKDEVTADSFLSARRAA